VVIIPPRGHIFEERATVGENAPRSAERLQVMLCELPVVNSPDFVSFSDTELLCALTSSRRRPNLFIDCTDGGTESVGVRLRALTDAPFYVCELPGPVELPSGGRGTLVLNDVAALTIAQQITLFDWLEQWRGAIQVISLTQKRLMDMVYDGRFLEGLFYRLNTISITGRGAREHVEHAAF
jgi:transcriptional regulator of aromatic amino acid metabolism